MNGLGLAASPNWYCSRVCDCNSDGLVAFGAKGDVFLLDISNKAPSYRGRLCSTGDRAVGLRYCSHVQKKNALVVAAESGKVKIWDVLGRVVTREFHQHKGKAMCVDWSPANPDLIASGDDKGFVCLYQLKDKWPAQLHFLNKAAIVTLAFCPHDDKTLAVGFRGGLILIVNVKQQCSTIHLLRRHEEDVQSLAWSPGRGRQFLGPNQSKSGADSASSESDDFILASSSKDSTLRIWSMAEGKLLTTSKMIAPATHRPRQQDDHAKSRLWMTAYWPALWPNIIYCSGPHGELLCYNFLKEGKEQWQTLNENKGPVHQRPVYSIVGFKEYACTISMDRQIIIWNLSVPCSQAAVPTLGGYVYCLQFSPVDPGLLAVGVGDNMIRVWNTQPSAAPYSVTNLWQGIKSKVTAISWHPTVEGRLAFGTEEGRVGVFSTLSNKPPAVFDAFHRGVVYTVTWGPNCLVDMQAAGEKKQNDLLLYSCGHGRIFVHNPRHLQHDALDIDDTIKKQNPHLEKFGSRTEVAWSLDHSLLAIGSEDGSIEIFLAPSLKRLVIIVEGRKLIQCLSWHPQFVTSSTEVSDCQFWLAAASSDSVVHVYTLAEHVAEAQTLGKEVTVASSSCKLEGHTSRVVALCWSPHVDGRLVSVSYDGTAQVWCVVTGTPVANFRGHLGRVYSTQWSPFDPDVVYTGAEDFTLQQWKVSEQKDKQPPEMKNVKTKYKKSKGAKRDVQQESVKDGSYNVNSVDELQELLEKRKEELKSQQNVTVVEEKPEAPQEMVTNTHTPDPTDDDKEPLPDVKPAVVKTNSSEADQMETSGVKSFLKGNSSKKKKKRTYKSMLPQSGRLENRGRSYTLDDIQLLIDHIDGQNKAGVNGERLYNENIFAAETSGLPTEASNEPVKLGVEETAHLGVFGNRLDAVNTLKTEAAYHREHDNVDYAIQTEIWRGNVSAGLKLAVEENCLSDWMVSLAPLASRDLWKTMCQSYADQLVREGSHHQAILYLLAIHNVHGAIDVLKTHISYRDAMVLAKTRLSPSDPILTELTLEWAAHAVKEGNFELAAKCYLSVRNFQQASEVLAQKTEASSLRMAAKLAALGEDHNKAASLAQESLTLFLQVDNWETAKVIIEEHSALKMYRNVVCLHEILQTELGRLNSNQTLWAIHQPDIATSLQIWQPYHIEGKPFLCAVLQAWICNGLITMTELDSAAVALEDLQKYEQGWQQPRTIAQLVHRTTISLTKSLLAAISGNDIQAMMHIVEALSLSYSCEFQQYFQSLCRLLLPTGILDVCGILPTDENPEQQAQNAFVSSLESVKAYYSMAVIQALLHEILVVGGDTKASSEVTSQNQTLSEIVLARCLQGIPGSSMLLPGAEGIPFIDKDESSEQSSETADNGDDMIHELIKHLLVDCQARKFVLEVQLECIKQAIAHLVAKERMCNGRKAAGHIRRPESSIQGQIEEAKSEIIEQITLSQDQLEQAKIDIVQPVVETSSVNFIENVKSAEVSQEQSEQADIGTVKPVRKTLSASISDNTEKTTDYVENLDEIAAADQDTNESGVDSDIVTEIGSFTIDYNLPCCVRYRQANVNRKLLEMELKRIELQLLDNMLDFPNPLNSGATIVKYCKLKQWDSLAREVEMWLSNFTTTLVGEGSESLL